MLVFYEAAHSRMTHSPDQAHGPEACAPATLVRIVDPVLSDLILLEQSTRSAGYGQDVKQAAEHVVNELRIFRAKLASHWEGGGDVPGLPMTERCMHAGQVGNFRSDIEERYQTLLKKAIP